MQSAKDAAASAKAGMDKTKATVQEKVDKMRAHDPVEKEMARETKEERIREAELNKQEAREENAATTGRHGTIGTGGRTKASGYGPNVEETIR